MPFTLCYVGRCPILRLAPGKPFVIETRQAPRKWIQTGSTLRVLNHAGRELIAYSPKPRAKSDPPPPVLQSGFKSAGLTIVFPQPSPAIVTALLTSTFSR